MTTTTGRRAPWSGVLAGVLLAAIVVVLTAWAVLAGGWVSGATASLIVGVGGLLEAALLARLGASRASAALIAPFLLAATVVPPTVRVMPTDGDTSAAHAASRYLEVISGGFFANSDWQFVVTLCATFWICGFWLGWCVVREQRGVLATLPCYTVLAVNALNAPGLSQVAVPETAAAGACLLVVMQAHLSRLIQRWRDGRVSVLPGVGTRFTRSGLFAAAAIVGLSLAMPPLTSRDISSSIFAARVHPPEPPESSSPSAGPPPSVAFSPVTRPSGPLTSAPERAVVFRTDAPATTYLRLANDTIFDAGSWYPDVPVGPRQPFGRAVVATVAGGDGPVARDREAGHGGVGLSESAVHTTITSSSMPARDLPYVGFSGEPEAASGAGTVVDAGLAYSPDSPLLTVDQVAPVHLPEPSRRLTSTALVPTATEAQLRSAGTAYPAFTAGLRTLPDDSSGGAAVVRSLAATWTAGLSNPYDQAKAIETALRDPSRFTYDLSPAIPPPGGWPITYFLATSHRGYCQYFASSMGAMLRSLGIPARLVNGYGPGVVAASETPGVTVHTVTTSDAHTWVEAYFPRYGWIPFEPTPPSSLGDYRPLPRGPAAAAAASPTPAPAEAAVPTPSPAPSPSPTPSPAKAAPPQTSRRSTTPVVAVAVAAGGTAVPAGLLLWWLRPRSLRALWLRLRLLGRLLGVRRGSSETDHAYTRRLAAALPGDRPSRLEALSRIAALSGAARFSAGGVPRTARSVWRPWWSSLAGAGSVALWRSLRRR